MAVHVPLLRRLVAKECPIVARPDEGARLYSMLVDLLWSLVHANSGEPVDRVIVVKDSEGKDPAKVEANLIERIARCGYEFRKGVQNCVVQQAMEAWLLADISALNAIQSRRKLPEVQGNIEDMVHPKRRLRQLLSEVGIGYTPKVAGDIAERIDLEVLRYRCPSFRRFEQAALGN